VDICVGEEWVGVNPKINNLIKSYRKAKYDLLWICDSNILMQSHALRVAADFFKQDPNVGLVHHAPEGTDDESFGAALEQLFLNTAHVKIYIVINYMALDSCVIGKSTLFRRSHLQQCGGLEAFGKYLAEDNMLGIALFRKGLLHRLSPLTAKQPLCTSTIADFLWRRSRWTRIRAYSMPGVTVLEPFTESIVSGLVGAWALFHLLLLPFWYVFGVHMLLWLLCDLFLVRGFTGAWPLHPLRFLFAWLVREVTAFPIYCFALSQSNIVTWRGRSYRLIMGGMVEAVDQMTTSWIKMAKTP